MSDTTQLESLLARYWGFQDLRPPQREAVRAILAGRDSVVVLPTGGGRSLCYQLPALTRPDGLAVVISPLISRMTFSTRQKWSTCARQEWATLGSCFRSAIVIPAVADGRRLHHGRRMLVRRDEGESSP